jgi:hypothetical protein
MTLEALVTADSLKGPRLEQVGHGEAFGLGVIDGVVRYRAGPRSSQARAPASLRALGPRPAAPPPATSQAMPTMAERIMACPKPAGC